MADHISSWKVAVSSSMSVAASEQLPKLSQIAKKSYGVRQVWQEFAVLAGEARRQQVSYGFATKK